jgi:hypothetical protein
VRVQQQDVPLSYGENLQPPGSTPAAMQTPANDDQAADDLADDDIGDAAKAFLYAEFAEMRALPMLEHKEL